MALATRQRCVVDGCRRSCPEVRFISIFGNAQGHLHPSPLFSPAAGNAGRGTPTGKAARLWGCVPTRRPLAEPALTRCPETETLSRATTLRRRLQTTALARCALATFARQRGRADEVGSRRCSIREKGKKKEKEGFIGNRYDGGSIDVNGIEISRPS